MEKDYSTETLLDALNQPKEYSLYICDWDKEQKTFIDNLESVFAEFVNATSKNRLKELHFAMNRHYTTLSKSARTTEKYVSERTKKYRDIMSVSYKDYNAFFFENLYALGSDCDEILRVVTKAKEELEGVVDKQIVSIKNIIKSAFSLRSDSVWEELKTIYLPNWELKKQRLLDYQITSMFNVIETEESNEDRIWVNRIANAITGFEVEYWNDEKEAELKDCLLKLIRQFEEAPTNEEPTENGIRLVLEDEGSQKVAQLNNKELSSMSQTMFNKMKSTIENFGQALSPEEKIQVLAKLLSEII